MKHIALRGLAASLALFGIFSCSPATYAPKSYAPQSEAATNGLRSGDQAINRNNIDAILNNPSREARPGLATGWGDQKYSSVSSADFTRSSSKPAGTDAIYYNDKRGIEAMTGNPQRVAAMQSAAGDLVEWGVKGKNGFLATYKEGGYGRRLVAGNQGEEYKIVVRNRCQSTLEIVASVDGLDVFDGKTASFKKNGYLIRPGQTFEIEGFRTSMNSVAAFKFSSVASSYANLRHGDTRNVGVIGLAVFTQKGVNPWGNRYEESGRRNTAQPFAEAPRNQSL